MSQTALHRDIILDIFLGSVEDNLDSIHLNLFVQASIKLGYQ